MRFLLCFLVLVTCLWRNALAQNVPQELLTAKKVYLRERGSDEKLLRQVREQIKKWGRWELSNNSKDADLVLVLKIEAKTLEKIQLKSLEEPHVTQPDEEYEVRTLIARTGAGRDLVSFSTRPTTAFAQKAEPTPENISKGEAIYKKHCLMCHGATGMGDGPAGKRLNPKPYNFQDKEKMATETDEHLLKEITKGKGPMPARASHESRVEQLWGL